MTTLSVYQKHDAHFNLVKAYAIINSLGEQVGTMSVKYPKDGMGKLFLYLHLHGSKMVQVIVSGCGFDKLSVAIQRAAMAYESDLTFKNDRDFIQALKAIDHNFDCYNKYANYRFLRAI